MTEAISSCHLVITLLPLVMAYLSPVAAIDPRVRISWLILGIISIGL